MGRSYLSIGLAAVFGLLVAAVVTIYEYTAPVAAEQITAEAEAPPYAHAVVVHAAHEQSRCATMSRRAHESRAAAEAQSAIVVEGRI